MPPRCSQQRSRLTSPLVSRSSPFAEVSADRMYLPSGQSRIRGIEDRAKAEAAYLGALQEFGGYESVTDFAFLFHRLCYLPESRRLVVWHTRAQLRLLMLLNQDIINEEDFRQRRFSLRLMDSRKRHIHVALTKASEQLTRLLDTERRAQSKRTKWLG